MKFPKIDKDKCIGCGVCVEMCPANAIVMDEGVAVICEKPCKNCKACINICPVNAINIINE